MHIKVVPLGAGQDVGRSCVLVSIGGKNIIFDCGMHMGYNDARRFPDFSYISSAGQFDSLIDCVIITHLYALQTHTQTRWIDGSLAHEMVCVQSFGSLWSAAVLYRDVWIQWPDLHDGIDTTTTRPARDVSSSSSISDTPPICVCVCACVRVCVCVDSIPRRPSVLSCSRTIARSRSSARARPTSSPRRTSRTA